MKSSTIFNILNFLPLSKLSCTKSILHLSLGLSGTVIATRSRIPRFFLRFLGNVRPSKAYRRSTRLWLISLNSLRNRTVNLGLPNRRFLSASSRILFLNFSLSGSGIGSYRYVDLGMRIKEHTYRSLTCLSFKSSTAERRWRGLSIFFTTSLRASIWSSFSVTSFLSLWFSLSNSVSRRISDTLMPP